MSKFPDPTKIYSAEPVGQTITPPPSDPLPSTPPSNETKIPSQVVPEQEAKQSPPPNNSLPPSPPSPSSPPPLPPSPSPFRNLVPLIIGIIGFALIAFLGFRFIPQFFGGKDEPVVLTYWGLWEPASVMESVIADYEREHPNVKINYQMQSPKNYRSRLQSAITDGSGPDIARIHNTWLPMFAHLLTPAPAGLFDLSLYYPVVEKDLTYQGELYAAPLEIDGLALYYNVDMLSEVSAEPPTDWNSFRKLAFDLTRRNETTGIIERAGAAMGTTSNVDHWSDILGLLILQNSGDPSKPSESAVTDALTFYTIFSTQDQSWSSAQPNSTRAFATGTLAMMLAPSWYVSEIQAINPTLNFATAPAPTLPATDLNWATYWAEAVSKNSQHSDVAWDFLSYLSSQEVLQKLYTTQAQLRGIGEPYPLTSLSSSLASDPLAAPFVSQGPSYSSWYLAARTRDEGLNDELSKYYEDSINAINSGSGVNSTLDTLSAGVAQVLGKYPLAQ